MNVRIMLRTAISLILFVCATVLAGDKVCYTYSSTSNHFFCTSVGNCTWWAASKRPDLAAAIDASGTNGWDGGQWYDKLKGSFPSGSSPKPGAIVELVSPTGIGHVAYVEKTSPDGSFSVTEMDWFGSLGNGNGVQQATYKPVSGGYGRDESASVWTLKGFIYAKGAVSVANTTCDPTKRKCDIRIKGDVGWYPPVGVCQNATQWFIIGTDASGKKYAAGSRPDSSACPLACYAN